MERGIVQRVLFLLRLGSLIARPGRQVVAGGGVEERAPSQATGACARADAGPKCWLGHVSRRSS